MNKRSHLSFFLRVLFPSKLLLIRAFGTRDFISTPSETSVGWMAKQCLNKNSEQRFSRFFGFSFTVYMNDVNERLCPARRFVLKSNINRKISISESNKQPSNSLTWMNPKANEVIRLEFNESQSENLIKSSMSWSIWLLFQWSNFLQHDNFPKPTEKC